MHQGSQSLLLFIALLIPIVSQSEPVITKNTNTEGVVEFSNPTSKKTAKKTLIYKSQTNNGITFSDQKPSNIAYEVLRFDCFACNPHSTINWHHVKLNHLAYADTVKHAAKRHNIDPALVRALIHAESAFKSQVTSHKGAQGLMQLMPATAKELGVNNALDPEQNIRGGVKYLAQLLHQFNGSTRLATAAYNAGPNAVKKYQGIPPYKETEVYVERVNILHQRYKNAS